MHNSNVFLPLRIRRHMMVGTDKSQYRVYRKGGDFVTLEARSALEAFRGSGFGDAERIVRVTKHLFGTVDRAAMTEAREYVETSLEGPANVISIDEPPPVEQEGLRPDTMIAPPQRVGANFLSEKGISDLLAAPHPEITAASDELVGFDEILPVSTPLPVKTLSEAARTATPPASSTQPTTEALRPDAAAPAAPAAVPGEAGKILTSEEVKTLLSNDGA